MGDRWEIGGGDGSDGEGPAASGGLAAQQALTLGVRIALVDQCRGTHLIAHPDQELVVE